MKNSSKSCYLLSVTLCAVGYGCGGSPDWGNAKTHAAIASLAASDIHAATIESDACPREPHRFPLEYLPEVLGQVRVLTPAVSIGRVEPWIGLHTLRLEAGIKGNYRIEFSTRDSLSGKVIAILTEDKVNGTVGFYEARAFWSWLAMLPEVEALNELASKGQSC